VGPAYAVVPLLSRINASVALKMLPSQSIIGFTVTITARTTIDKHHSGSSDIDNVIIVIIIIIIHHHHSSSSLLSSSSSSSSSSSPSS
jgi:hypothetical protein